LHLGDIEGYRGTCERMLERFEQTTDLSALNVTATTCSVAPEAVADLVRPLRLAEKALALHPEDQWSHESLGRILYRAGRYEGAVTRLGEAVEILNKTGNAWHWLFLAMAHHHLGHADEARSWLRKAGEWLDQELPKPSGVGGSWLSWDQRVELQLLRREAEALIQEGRPLYLPADVFSDRLNAATPGDGPLLVRRGRTHAAFGRWEQAIADYGTAVELGVDDFWVHIWRGEALAQQGRWAEVDADFAAAIERGAEGVNPWYVHALLRLQLGDVEGYRRTCEQMLERFARIADLESLQLAASTCSYAPEAVADLARPLSLAEKAIALDPQDQWSHDAAGRILYRAGRYEEAVRRLGEAVELVNKHLGHTDAARSWLEKAGAWIDQELAKPSDAGGSPLVWNQRLELRILRREAEALIRDGRPLYLPADVFRDHPAPP
jgi:tetratricopeptide (TPR) repeat protein